MDRKFGRKKDNRNHLVRNLLTSLVLFEKIVTTEAKAKTLKSEIDRVISNAKKQEDLTARRNLAKIFFDQNAVKKTMEILVPRYASRTSGFTRLVRLGVRVGDGAPKFQIELINEEKPVAAKAEKVKAGKKVKDEVKKDEVTTESEKIEEGENE